MKVLQVITKAEAGGAQTHVIGLCCALRGTVELSVAVGEVDAGALSDAMAGLNIPLHRLPQMRNTLAPWRIALAVHALWRLLRRERPDLVHAHSAIAGLVARLAGRLAGIPVVYTVHGFGFKPQVAPLRRWLSRLAERLCAPWTAHMICVSAHERTLAHSLPLAHGRISVIDNAVEDSPHRAEPGREPLRVVMVARCAPPKRHDLLLQALALLAARTGRAMAATLVGAGPGLDVLRRQAGALGLGNVVFAGDSDRVAEMLGEHGVFVLMSEHEGQPISVIEAMRAGLPVVASDLPGLREMIDAGREGLLVHNTAEALAEALLQLAGQPELRARMGQAARRGYETRYTLEPMARKVWTVYERTLSR